MICGGSSDRSCLQRKRDRLRQVTRTRRMWSIQTHSPRTMAQAISHSDDFRSVTYHGQEYTFTRNQAAAIRLLWQQEGGELGQDYILAEIESLASRLRDVFKQKNGVHPAWGTLIVSGQKKGTFRLNSHEKA